MATSGLPVQKNEAPMKTDDAPTSAPATCGSCASDQQGPPTVLMLNIPNMDRRSEALMRTQLGQIKGIEDLSLDSCTGRLSVRHRLSSTTPIFDALLAIGVKGTVATDGESLSPAGCGKPAPSSGVTSCRAPVAATSP